MFDKFMIYEIRETGARCTIYREDLEEILEDARLESSDIREISIEEFSAAELASLLAGELENANFHSMVEIPELFLSKLSDRGVDESGQREAIWALAESCDYSIL